MIVSEPNMPYTNLSTEFVIIKLFHQLLAPKGLENITEFLPKFHMRVCKYVFTNLSIVRVGQISLYKYTCLRSTRGVRVIGNIFGLLNSNPGCSYLRLSSG